MAQPAEFEQVTYNAPDGAQFGKTTSDKIACYGSTPVDQYTAVPAASTYATTTNTTAVFGFDSLAAITSLVLTVSTMNAAGKRLGLWA